MPDWLPLPRVAAAPGMDERAIARRGNTVLTRRRFLHDVGCWQTRLAAVPGRRIALYEEDVYAFAAALYGAWHAGKEVYLPGDVLPATLERLLPGMDACVGALPNALRAAPEDASGPRTALDPRTTRLVIYTSGSSGEPSAIPKRLEQLDAEMHNLQQAFGARLAQGSESSTVLSTVSHQHIYGLLFCVLWPLAAGRVVDAQRLAYPEQMALHLGQQPSVLVSSPAHLRRLPESLDWAAARAALRAVFSSGGPLPPEAAGASLALLGHSPTEVYGSSETGGIAWRQRAVHGDRWNPLPGVSWRMHDDDLLAVRSAHLEDAGWWQTNDRARPHGDGGFVLLGRADRIVKIEEKRVSLTTIENAACASGLVEQARGFVLATGSGPRLAVVAVPSARGWDTLHTRGKRHFNALLRAEWLKVVERVALPRRLRYVRALPVNSQGKSTEALLQALFRPSMPTPVWQRRDQTHASARLVVDTGLSVFDGHFAQAPVLPGVAQVDWAIALGRQCFALPPRFLRLEVLKFQRPVLPPARLALHLEWQPTTGQLSFRYESGQGTLHASGRTVWGAADV